MDDLSVEELSYGFSEVLKTCEDLPAPATVRKLIEARHADGREERAHRALTSLDALITAWGADRIPEWKKGGLRRAPKLDAPTRYALESIGGWRTYALAGDPERRFLRKAFLEAHKRYSKRLERRQHLKVGGGSFERTAETGEPNGLPELGPSEPIQ